MNLDELRLDCAIKQKRGLHFIIASVVIWSAVLLIHLSSLDILTKNLLTFCCTAPLMPLSFLISKWIKVDFQNKSNPLTQLGLLFSINQIIYLIIVMWVYPTIPDKMLMVLAIIFGAHLMPFSWLYHSKTYLLFSIFIPITSLVVGLCFQPVILALVMILFELLFCIILMVENKSLNI